MFQFYTYIRPEWYFSLASSKVGPVYFPDYDTMSDKYKNRLHLDTSFDSMHARKWDLAYQLFKGGVSGLEEYGAGNLPYDVPISLHDNYRFVYKHFGWAWVLYVYIVRVFFSFYNPLKETRAFIVAVKRSAYSSVANTEEVDGNQNKEHELHAPPRKFTVSVILPTLNRYPYLHKALSCLEKQTYNILEVIVIDQSDHFDEAFYKSFNLPIKVIHQSAVGQWLARNEGIKCAKGELIALYEDDILVSPQWLLHHVEFMLRYNADISSGSLSTRSDQSIYSYKEIVHYSHFLPGGNSLIKKQVFEKIGLFDRQYDGQRWGDGEWGMRAYLAGYKNLINNKAFCVDQKAKHGGLRTRSRSGYNTLGFRLRPLPSVFYFLLQYQGKKSIIPSIALHMPGSFFTKKEGEVSYMLGLWIMLLLFPYWLFGILLAYRRAKKMIQEGNRIEYIQ